MAIQEMTKPFAKEADDVGVMLVSLVKAIKAKKSPTEIMGGELQHLMDALSGLDQLDDEAKASPEVLASTIGYHVGAIPGILLTKPVILA